MKRLLPLAKVLNSLPFSLQKPVLERVLNRVFAESAAAGALDFLAGRHLGIRVPDLELGICLTYVAPALQVEPPGRPCDACISAGARDFILLASRREDPDTLFFQRRMMLSGDTELGLAAKNLLDSIDPASLPVLLRKGLDVAGGLAAG